MQERRVWQDRRRGCNSDAAMQLSTAHLRHVEELPGARKGADWNFDQCRTVATRECPAQRPPQFFGTAGALGFGAKTPTERDKVRIGQVAADKAVAEALLLDAPHVAEGAVVKHDRDQWNAVAHRSRHLGGSEHEAAI